MRLELENEEIDLETMKKIEGRINPEYIQLFNYLCRNFEKKVMFNQDTLIICARARNIIRFK